MKSKVLAVVVGVLALVVVFETAYLINTRKNFFVPMSFVMPYRHMMQPMKEMGMAERNLDKAWQWDPLEDTEAMQQEIDNMFNNRFARAFKHEKMEAEALFQPKIGIKETKNEYIITVDLPGMNKEDINVEVSDHYLSLYGERKSEKSEENKKIFREEQDFGYFSRTISLPAYVDTANIAPEYINGVLTIRMPIIRNEKGPEGAARKIPIK